MATPLTPWQLLDTSRLRMRTLLTPISVANAFLSPRHCHFSGDKKAQLHRGEPNMHKIISQKAVHWQSFHWIQSTHGEARCLRVPLSTRTRVSAESKGVSLTRADFLYQFHTICQSDTSRHWWFNWHFFHSSAHRLSTYMGPIPDVL